MLAAELVVDIVKKYQLLFLELQTLEWLFIQGTLYIEKLLGVHCLLALKIPYHGSWTWSLYRLLPILVGDVVGSRGRGEAIRQGVNANGWRLWMSMNSSTSHFPIANSRRKLTWVTQSSFSPVLGCKIFIFKNNREIRTVCHSFGPSGVKPTSFKRGVMVGYTCRLQSPREAQVYCATRCSRQDTTLERSSPLPLEEWVQVATYVTDWKENRMKDQRAGAPGLELKPLSSQPPLQFCKYDTLEIGFITTDDFTNANILEATYPAVAKRLHGDWITDPAIPVLTGFLGKGSKSCAVTTFGRGGSDLTATTIGKALRVREIQVWKDVDGVLT
ncbi:hypothetical protein IFM89_019283 [Coptis chinensis]|uniref:Aspartate/glutamate/uridylate kinase domain-containing protein n=1 Tax=Coptis chinensis TaxID=261450 RepID=A0A835H4Y1_9MAGN|nr:hypothetical protein IFM89_019283 [Coptis chinensis]